MATMIRPKGPDAARREIRIRYRPSVTKETVHNKEGGVAKVKILARKWDVCTANGF